MILKLSKKKKKKKHIQDLFCGAMLEVQLKYKSCDFKRLVVCLWIKTVSYIGFYLVSYGQF